MEENKTKKSVSQKVVTVIGIALIVIMVPILIFNMIIIFKGMGSEEPPMVFGVTPLVVLTGSMEDNKNDEWESLTFPAGCMIFIEDFNFADLDVGDVITYKEGKSFTTHRIIEKCTDADGTVYFRTKGDANNICDQDAGRPNIYEADVVGQYTGKYIIGMGYFSNFVKKPVGILVVVGVPVIAFIVYDILVRRKEAKEQTAGATAINSAQTAELELMRQELERLKAQQSASASTQNPPDNNA